MQQPQASTSTAYPPQQDISTVSHLLGSALTQPDPIALSQLTTAFEDLPSAFSPLFPVVSAAVSDIRPLVAKWAANVLQVALCRNLVAAEEKSSLALQAVPAVSFLLAASDVQLQKIGLQCLASIYPLLFKQACMSADQTLWARVIPLKARALQLYREGSLGSKISAVKVIQRVIQTQTKGSADPRLQRTAEPNLSLCRANHPFLRIGVLEDEANKLLEECITTLFTSDVPDIVSAITTTLSNLVKTRPTFANLIITALTNWTPAALSAYSNATVRGVEKNIRISLTHLLKTAHANSFAAQINDFLNRQDARMEQAVVQSRQNLETEAGKKRQSMAEEITNSTKRRRLEPNINPAAAFSEVGARRGADPSCPPFDVTSLPLQAVMDLLVSSFQSIQPQALASAIQDARRNLPASEAANVATPIPGPPPPFAPQLDVMIDPLKLDLGDEELDLKTEVPAADLNPEDEADNDASQLAPYNFELTDATVELGGALPLSVTAKTAMIESALRRICASGEAGLNSTPWVVLVSRLITRGLYSDPEEENVLGDERKESLRGIIFDFIVSDLQSRMDIARHWLSEEWYADGLRGANSTSTRPYDRWLRRLLQHILDFSSNKDKSIPQLIVDLPELPAEEIRRLGEMCTNPEQVQLGFSALRDLAVLRPPVRQAAIDVLLSLTAHPDKLTRNAAILTVKRWVPAVSPLSEHVVSFALVLLARLEIAPPASVEPEADLVVEASPMEGVVETTPAVKAPPPVAVVRNGEVIDGLPPPSTTAEVVQHIELYFALCTKSPELIVTLFQSYPRLQPLAQEAIQNLIPPMIRVLGPKDLSIAKAIETCPVGADSLALRVLVLLMDKGRLPASLIENVKVLASTRDLPPRFYVMIIADCRKSEIIKYAPRVASLLNNTPQEKAVVRSVFLSILAAGSQIIRSNELLSPVELLTLLHHSEKEAGLKSTIEAISICFSMPDAFRAEILASFMQHILEEPTVPVLFLRTVIQAITTYKPLQPFVSTTLLPRLVAKQVWNTGPLWEGFIRCAKLIAPHSFLVLLQLPREQLQDVVTRQPTLKEPLREFLAKKASTVALAAQNAELLAILGDAPMVSSIENSPAPSNTEDQEMGMTPTRDQVMNE